MKYIYLARDSIENRYLYGDYDELEKGMNIFISDVQRKPSKALVIAGCKNRGLYNAVLFPILYRTVKKRVESRGWNNIGKDLCFVIHGSEYEAYQYGLIDFLRGNYPGCRIAVYFVDLISIHRVDIDKVKKDVDVVFSNDPAEAEKYGIHWLMEPFSEKYISAFDKNLPIKWDVTYVGHCKDRYSDIMRLYDALRERGYSLDFHIIGVPKEKRVRRDEIGYEVLPFEELLRHVVQSRCVAEILRKNVVFPTTRFSEAMMLKRNLLTDASFFYGREIIPSNVIYFEKIEDIAFDRITAPAEEDFEYYQKLLSIKAMITTIEKKIEEMQ